MANARFAGFTDSRASRALTNPRIVRLWTLHPRLLDATGLVALWREALLAREVLRGRTVGYRHHPQLQRFRSCACPRAAINQYLAAVHAESVLRGYRFDPSKLGRRSQPQRVAVTDGQLCYEWNWLMQKLALRSPTLYRRHLAIVQPDAHPMFRLLSGPVAEWENVRGRPASTAARGACASR